MTKKTMKFCPNYTVAASTSRKTPMVTVYISSQQSRKKQQHNIKQEDFLIKIMDCIENAGWTKKKELLRKEKRTIGCRT